MKHTTVFFILSVMVAPTWAQMEILTGPAVVPAPAPLKCLTPPVNPNAKNTPVDVVIDQEAQLIYITYPSSDGKGTEFFSSRISTGGGLKIPNGVNPRPPYCAKTPEIKTKIIPAIKAEDFDKTRCTDKEIRARSTVFKQYYTETFSDGEGNPIPMPNAIRLDNEGDFLHTVPPSYAKLLGENVSGGCVRLNPRVSEILFKQMLKHGAIRVTVKPPPTPNKCKPQYCDDKIKDQAKLDIASGKIPVTRRTGSDGIAGSVEGFFDGWSCPDTKNSKPVAAKKVFPIQAEGRQ